MDEYSVAGGGGLRLKGAKVKKHKKKKTGKGGSDLEKALSTGDDKAASSEPPSKRRRMSAEDGEDAEDQTETNRRDGQEEEGGDDGVEREGEKTPNEPLPSRRLTEAEKRFEEVKRKKLLDMAGSASSRPQLLKTHKERVEELNTYLSKLSEHHDMPKIGPG